MSSRTEKFQRKPSEKSQLKKDEVAPYELEEELRFSPEEEAVRFLVVTNKTRLLTLYSLS
jgi:hypothetical protein